MSFFGPPCCCKGMERTSKYRLPYRQIGRSKIIFFKIFQNQCRFGGSKVAVGWWEEVSQEIGSVLAPDSRGHRQLAPFWRQKAKTKAGFSRVASILMPPPKAKSDYGINFDAIEMFFLRSLIFFAFSWSTTWGRFQKNSEAPIKTGLLIPYLVRGFENFLPEGLIFPLSRDLPLEEDKTIFGSMPYKTEHFFPLLNEGLWNFSSKGLNFSAFPWSTTWGDFYPDP